MQGGTPDLGSVDLALTTDAVLEQDRGLADAETVALDAPDHLLQEGVATRPNGEGVDGLEHLTRVAAVAAGAVTHGEAQEDARVDVREGAQEHPVPRPVRDAAAGDVAGADHHVVVGHPGEHLRQVLRLVAEVAVHGQNTVVPVLEAVAEAGQVSGAEAELALALEQVEPGFGLHLATHEVGGAVRTGIVDHQDLQLVGLSEDFAGQEQDVLGLVVGGQYDQGAHRGTKGTPGLRGDQHRRLGTVLGGADSARRPTEASFGPVGAASAERSGYPSAARPTPWPSPIGLEEP